MATNTTFVGYARTATQSGLLWRQVDALWKAGCGRVFVEVASGMRKDREGLAAALDCLGKGDVLVVWQTDPLSRSRDDFAEVFAALDCRGAGFCSLSNRAGTIWPGRRSMIHALGWPPVLTPLPHE